MRDERWDFLEEMEFPKLNRLNKGKMKEIIEKMLTGKATAFGGVSDNRRIRNWQMWRRL